MLKKAGSVPFQINDGIVHICLVTSKKRKNKFVLPKGTVRSSETSYAAAKRETMEEAGLKGQMSRKGIKIRAISADSDRKMNVIKYFPIYISKILEDWPEIRFRKRLWVDINRLPKSIMVKRDIKVLKSKLISNIIKSYKQKSVA